MKMIRTIEDEFDRLLEGVLFLPDVTPEPVAKAPGDDPLADFDGVCLEHDACRPIL